MIRLSLKKRLKQIFCRHHWRVLAESETYGHDSRSLSVVKKEYRRLCGKERFKVYDTWKIRAYPVDAKGNKIKSEVFNQIV